MALKFTDGFDSYAATADLVKKWGMAETPWVWHATNGRTGAGCVQAATTGGARLRTKDYVNTPLNGIFAYGFWLKISAIPVLSSLVQLNDANGSIMGYIKVAATTGFLTLYSMSLSLTATGNINVCDNAWHWVEVYSTIASVTGTHKCNVDGTSQWNGSYSPSNFSTVLAFVEFLSMPSATITLDDVMMYDSSGSGMIPATVWPLGTRQIATLRPTSDSSVQFTRSTGATNFSLIDEVNPDVSDYVESGTSNQQDLYGYGDIGFTPAAVNGVMLNGYVHNPNPGGIAFQQSAKSSATTVQGTSTAAPVNPRIFQEPFVLDPNGSIAWTGAAVDAATFGIKVV